MSQKQFVQNNCGVVYFTPLYRKNPDDVNIEHSVLDDLFALGKSERDFKWVLVPEVIRLND